jgi:thioesterase domain-containing protein
VLAVAAVERLRREGLQLDVLTLLQNPVVEELATRIGHRRAPSDERAIPVRRARGPAPLFFVPTGLGDYSYVFELARDLDLELPIYALPWQVGDAGAGLTLEAMAARKVELMQAACGPGPYRLAGYSSGGILAYAIAHHLVASGEEVSFIGLIDVGVPKSKRKERPTASEILRGFLLTKVGEDQVARASIEQLPDDAPLQLLVQEGLRMGLLTRLTDAHGWISIWERVRTVNEAIDAYVPPSITAAVHLFHTADDVSRYGWEPIVSSSYLRYVHLQGDHQTLMTDAAHRKDLAGLLRAALR